MEHLIDFFSQYGYKRSDNKFHRFKNPLDPTTKNRNAVVNFEYNYVHDHKLGTTMTIAEFVAEVKAIPISEAREYVGILEFKVSCDISNSVYDIQSLIKLPSILPDEWVSLYDTSPLANICRNYWEERGMSIDKLYKRGWGLCTEGYFAGRTIIPYKVLGKTVYFQARTFLDALPKYLFPKTDTLGKSELFYNQDALYKYDKGFMVEGAVDAECVGDNCIAIGGWKLSSTQIDVIRNSRWKELHIIPDAGFEIKAQSTGWYFKDMMDVYIHKIPDNLGKDVNEVGFNNIIFNNIKL